jgi:hypothetical protein
MRHIDGIYTQRFNRRYECDGPLFRGRYKSIVIEDDSHILEVMRYIHRNPIKAKLEKSLGEYPWCSHRGYILDSEAWNWLYKDFILSMFSNSRLNNVKQYLKFVSKVSPKDVQAVFEAKKQPSVFGGERFKKRIRQLFSKDMVDYEVPESRILVPDIEEIEQAVCNFYNVTKNDLSVSRRGMRNEPRNMAVFLIRRFRGEKLSCLAEYFNMGKYSTVSSVITRFQNQLINDKEVKLKHDKILHILKKSQAKVAVSKLNQ